VQTFIREDDSDAQKKQIVYVWHSLKDLSQGFTYGLFFTLFLYISAYVHL